MIAESVWNGLEIVKLIVGAFIPISVVLIGFVFSRALKRVEASQWLNQKLIEKRVELIGTALPWINDLYCYFTWRGGWKELSPRDVIERKRMLDRLFYANRSFFSAEVLDDYQAFSDALFKTFTAPGADAQLRTAMTSLDGDRAKVYPGEWQQEWAALFVAENENTAWDKIDERHAALLTRLGAEVGAR